MKTKVGRPVILMFFDVLECVPIKIVLLNCYLGLD